MVAFFTTIGKKRNKTRSKKKISISEKCNGMPLTIRPIRIRDEKYTPHDRLMQSMKARGFSWRETNIRKPRKEHPQLGESVPSQHRMRLGTIPLDIGLYHIHRGSEKVWLCGTLVDFTGQRLRTYTKGVTCVSCGVQGSYFAIERYTPYEDWHVNLWAIIGKGSDSHTMMTSDHIVARSKGGGGNITNRQPMCQSCNNRKGNKPNKEFLDQQLKLKERQKRRLIYAAIVRQFNGAVQ